MKKISGFTFIHNALAGGYPIREAIQAVLPYVDEVVVIDMESTDGTVDFIKENFPKIENDPFNVPSVRIEPGKWGNDAGETLRQAHSLNVLCEHKTILHFEADEVYDDMLLREIAVNIKYKGVNNLAVYRLQLEQNFQRCRWYPKPVHRVFEKGCARKEGHTTHVHKSAKVIGPSYGFLWDITNCFRDNWKQRYIQQDELRHNSYQVRYHVPLHFTESSNLEDHNRWDPIYEKFLSEDHWTWNVTPFDIPDVLQPLVGMTKYE